MRLASRIAWRSSVSRPGRTITSILGIAVGVAAVLSVLIVDHNTILTERLGRPSFSGKPDLEIRPVDAGAPASGVPAALVRHPSLREVRPVFFSRIRVHPGGGGEGRAFRDVELVAVDPRAGERFDAWVVAEGEEFAAADASDVLVSAPLAAELGIAPGDVIGLQRALPSVHQCREGEVVAVRDEQVQGAPEPFRVAGLLEPNHLGRRRAVLVPYDRGTALFQGAHVQPIYWARLAPEAIYQDVREDLKASFVVDKPKGALVGERVDQRAFRKSIRIAACLSLLLGLFVIYNAFSLSLVERVREIGLLRALGLTGTEIAAAVVIEGLLLSVAGAALGLVLSLGVVDVMRRIGITTLGYGKPLAIHDVPWDVVALVLVAGVVAAMAGMIAPLLRVRRLSVIEAVRAGRIAYRPDPTRFVRALAMALLPGALLLLYMVATPPLGDRQQAVFWQVAKVAFWVSITFGAALLVPRAIQAAVALVLRALLSFRPVERPVAVAAVEGAHHRVFGSTLGIALVLAAVLGIHAITTSLKDEAARFGERTMNGRAFLQTRPLAKEVVAEAAAAAGAASFYSLSAEVLTPFPIRGIDPEVAIRHVPGLKGDPHEAEEFRAGRSMVLSEFLADSHGYSVGDRVSLSTYAGAYPVRVAAIDDTFGYWPDDRSFGLLAMPAFRDIFCIDDAEGGAYVLHAGEGRDPADVLAATVAALPADQVLRARTATEIQEFYRGDMDRDFWIFQVILILTGLLAFVGLWNSLTVALLERRRELGLLRTLGFTPGQLGGMLAAESAALGVVGGGLALAAGVPVSGTLVEAIRVISRLDVRYVATGGEMGAVVGVAVGLALVATVLPAMRVRVLVAASATRME